MLLWCSLVGRDLSRPRSEGNAGAFCCGPSATLMNSIRRLVPDVACRWCENGHYLALRGRFSGPVMSSCVVRAAPCRSEFHQRLVVFGGHFHSSLFSSCAFSSSSAGISNSSRWPSLSLKRYIFINSTSMNALKPGPWLTAGYCTMTGFARRRFDRLDRRFEIGLVGVQLAHHADHGFLEQPGVTGLESRCHQPFWALNRKTPRRPP